MTTFESSDLNESNLNFLNEEASRFKEEDEVYPEVDIDEENEEEEIISPRDIINPNQNQNFVGVPNREELPVHQNLNQNLNKKFQVNNKIDRLSPITNTKYIENLSKELNEKKHKIEFLQEQNSEKDILIENLKKNIKTLQDKLLKTSKTSKNIQNRQFNEIESELKLLGSEYMKLQETVSNKDKIINEFSKLSENTKSKFKMFEDANRILQEENEILNRTIEDYKNSLIPRLIQSENLKENQIKELKELLSEYEKKSEKEKIELIKKEENLRVKYEDKEATMKQKFKEREENLKSEYFKEIVELNSNLEGLKTENEKLKSEMKNVKHKYEDRENEMQIKEIEYQKNLEKLEKETLKLKKNLKDTENESKLREQKLEERIENLNRSSLEKEKNLNQAITIKDKKISQLEDEANKNRNVIASIQTQLKEEEYKIQNFEDLIKQLKNQNSEILNEMNLQKNNFDQIEENKEKEVYQILIKLNEIVEEKNELEELNEELKKNLKMASDKIRELNELILDKYQGIELSFYKEKSHKEYLERKYRDAFKSMKSEEEKLREELSMVRNQLDKKSEENEKMKIKYENKIQTLQLKLDEETYCRENLQDELEILKANLGIGAKASSSKHYLYEDPPVRLDKKPQYSIQDFSTKNMKNSDDMVHFQTLDNFKELIKKMDQKLGETVVLKYDNNSDYLTDKKHNHIESENENISLKIPFIRIENNNTDREGELVDGNMGLSDIEGDNHIENQIEKHIAEIKNSYKF